MDLRWNLVPHTLGVPKERRKRQLLQPNDDSFSLLHEKRTRVSYGYFQFPAVAGPVLKVQLWSKASAYSRTVPLTPPPVWAIIHTDASQTGKGGHTKQEVVQGTWFPVLQTCHIIFLELMAAFLSLKHLRPPRNSHLHWDRTNGQQCSVPGEGIHDLPPSFKWFFFT